MAGVAEVAVPPAAAAAAAAAASPASAADAAADPVPAVAAASPAPAVASTAAPAAVAPVAVVPAPAVAAVVNVGSNLDGWHKYEGNLPPVSHFALYIRCKIACLLEASLQGGRDGHQGSQFVFVFSSAKSFCRWGTGIFIRRRANFLGVYAFSSDQTECAFAWRGESSFIWTKNEWDQFIRSHTTT
jgi:hypothetical protein